MVAFNSLDHFFAVNVEVRHYSWLCSLVFSCTGCTVSYQLYIYTYTAYNRYIATLQTISLRETLTSDMVSYGILLDGCFHCD